MTYTRVGPFTNGGAPFLSAATFNTFEDGISVANAYTAPAPSGGDDTAVLNGLIQAAQNGNGTVYLQAGTYLANLAPSDLTVQPTIIGRGRTQTVIHPYNSALPVVKFSGGSGSIAGGGLRSLTVQATTNHTGVGVEFNGCGGVDCVDVRITNFAEGVRFHNETGSDFTEFCTVQGGIDDCVLAVRYKVANGVESFHGSGLLGNTVIQMPTAATTAIQVDSGATPYNAPLVADVFTDSNTAGQTVIVNNNASRISSFYGTLRLECGGGATVGSNSGYAVWLQGGVTALAGSPIRLGKLYLVDKIYMGAAGSVAQYRQFQRSVTCVTGTTPALPDTPGTCLIQANISASGYLYSYLLYCWASPTSSTGTVTVLANTSSVNTAGYGAPTFAWTSNQLQIINGAYPSNTVTAYLSVTPIFSPISTDILGQY